MTIRVWSELNPTAELRDWRFISGTEIRGSFFGHPYCDNGTVGMIINIKSVTDYRDHKIVVTHGNEYYLLNKLHRHLNRD